MAAFYDVIPQYPGSLSQTWASSKSLTLTASLDSTTDSGLLGDNVTGFGTVKINLGNVQANSLAWLDVNNNAIFDPATDIAAVGGVVSANLAPGSNSLTFYQKSSGSPISDPTYLAIKYDAAAAVALDQQQDFQLAIAALAYLGRPLTKGEYDAFKPSISTGGRAIA